MIWWHDIWYMTWYMIWYDIYVMTCDMMWYDMLYDMIYDDVWYDMMAWHMIWYMIRYIWYDIWHMWYMMIYMIWHDIIYLLTAIWLTPSGSSTVHIYTQTIHRTTQLLEECWPCPVFASYTLIFALQLRKKHGKTSVRVVGEWNNSAPTGRIFMKFYTYVFFENQSRKLQRSKNLTRITGTLHEDLLYIYDNISLNSS
jgi:hypothetical protein